LLENVLLEDTHVWTLEYPQSLQTSFTKLILWQHARHCLAYDLGVPRPQEIMSKRQQATYFIRLLVHHVLILDLLQTSRILCVLPVQNLVCLPPGNLDLISVRDDHIVATVDYHLQSDQSTSKKDENVPPGS
jgi:hypothetical protein